MTPSKLTSFLVCFTVFHQRLLPDISCLCLSSASAFPQTHVQMLSLDVTLYVSAWSHGAGSVLTHSLYLSVAFLTPLFHQRGFNSENGIRVCYWERITVDCWPAEAFVPFAYLAHRWCICCFYLPPSIVVSIGYQILKMRKLCIKICTSRWNWR